MKKNKLFLVIAVTVFALCLAIGLAGCNGKLDEGDKTPSGTSAPFITWDDFTLVTAPTCDTAGLETRTASDGTTQTRVIPALGHDYQWVVTKIATDEFDGEETQICRRDPAHIGATRAIPATGYPDLVFTRIVSATEDGYSVKASSTLAQGKVIVPSIYNGLPVLSIESMGFYSKKITEITLPSTLKEIGNHAFLCCSELTSLVVSSSVTRIGMGAFAGCTQLQSLTVPFIGEKASGTASNYFSYWFDLGKNASKASTANYATLKTVTITGGGAIVDDAFINWVNDDALINNWVNITIIH